MKVVFVSLGHEYLGVEIMAACLKEAGHQVNAFCDESLFDDKNYFTVPWLARLFNRRRLVIEQIVAEAPDLVGLSVISSSFLWAQEIARGVKELRPETRIIMGGIHATSAPENVIAKDCVDMICLGEGHQAIVELADALEAGQGRTDIANIWFKQNGQVVRNDQRMEQQDVDRLPDPFLDKSVYEGRVPLGLAHLSITQFGCPFACNYCALSIIGRNSKELSCKAVRYFSVDKVIRELMHYKRLYDYSCVFFMTNTFTADKDWLLEFGPRYTQAVGLPYKIATHPTRVDVETAQALKDSGCYEVQLGIESYSPEVRRDIFNRRETNEQIQAAVEAMDQVGLVYTIDYIMGAPLQGEEEYRQAAAFFIEREKCVRVTPFMISFLPGTPLVDLGLKHGLITQAEVERLNEGLMDTNYLHQGSVEDKAKLKNLYQWRLFFRLIPVLPKSISRRLIVRDRFKLLSYLPIGPFLLLFDIAVSFIARDHVALSYMKMYFWHAPRILKAKLLRRFKRS